MAGGHRSDGCWFRCCDQDRPYRDHHTSRKPMTILKPMTIFRSHLETYDYLSPKPMSKMPRDARFQGENLGKIVPKHQIWPIFLLKIKPTSISRHAAKPMTILHPKPMSQVFYDDHGRIAFSKAIHVHVDLDLPWYMCRVDLVLA